MGRLGMETTLISHNFNLNKNWFKLVKMDNTERVDITIT